jgi:hypothetical protein
MAVMPLVQRHIPRLDIDAVTPASGRHAAVKFGVNAEYGRLVHRQRGPDDKLQ